MQEIGRAFKPRPPIGPVEQQILDERGSIAIKFINQLSHALIVASEVYQNEPRPMPLGLLMRLDLVAHHLEDAARLLQLDSTISHIKRELGIRERIPEGDA